MKVFKNQIIEEMNALNKRKEALQYGIIPADKTQWKLGLKKIKKGHSKEDRLIDQSKIVDNHLSTQNKEFTGKIMDIDSSIIMPTHKGDKFSSRFSPTTREQVHTHPTRSILSANSLPSTLNTPAIASGEDLSRQGILKKNLFQPGDKYAYLNTADKLFKKNGNINNYQINNDSNVPQISRVNTRIYKSDKGTHYKQNEYIYTQSPEKYNLNGKLKESLKHIPNSKIDILKAISTYPNQKLKLHTKLGKTVGQRIPDYIISDKQYGKELLNALKIAPEHAYLRIIKKDKDADALLGKIKSNVDKLDKKEKKSLDKVNELGKLGYSDPIIRGLTPNMIRSISK